MSEITKEAEILLHLLQKHFRPETENLPEAELKAADWQAVWKEAAHQAVLISAFDAAAAYRAYMPVEVYMQTFQRVSRGMMSNLRVNNAQRALGALLEGKGYPYVILKGEAAAAYYPKPELRHLGDVDFLIDPRQKAELTALLVETGYIDGKHENQYHTDFSKDGVALEMHFQLPGLPDGRARETVLDYIKDLLTFTPAAIDHQGGFPAPAAPFHGLILLLHMQKHMTGSGLGLRHLCDWAAFVERTWQASFWQQKLLPLLREIGLLKYTAVMTKVCALALGTVCPDWAEAEDELCAAVLHDILTGGNFGRKDALRSRAGMMVPRADRGGSEKGTVYRLWNTLHRSTGVMYPIVRKYRILHPVMDVYRVGVYGFRRLTGQRPSLRKLAPLAQARRSVYEQLEIFETEK